MTLSNFRPASFEVASRGVTQADLDAEEAARIAGDEALAAITVILTAAGSGNTINATADRPFTYEPYASKFIMPAKSNNSGNVTISIGGGPRYSLLTNAGAHLEAGYIVAGLIVEFRFDGHAWRLTSGVSEAGYQATLQALVDEAQASANAAAASATAAAGSAVSAAGSATTASAAAAAASAAIGAMTFNTKALASAGIGSVVANGYVRVLVDETQADQHTLYQKVSGAYVYIRAMGDLTVDELTEKYGFGGHMRWSLSAMGKIDRDAIGANGPGNPNDFPLTITATQSGTSVTATAAVLWKYHVGAVIRWSTGEEARIVDVASLANTNTCTVDRSQTVASASAVINPKHYVQIYEGDSLGHHVGADLMRWGWRSMGFGGYIMMANNYDATSMMVAALSLAGGAADQITTTDYNLYPYSTWMTLPAGGTISASLLSHWVNGVFRQYRLGIEPEKMLHDTAYIVWRRGAGSFSVQRRRFSDAEWESVATVANTNVGSRAFNFVKYSHPMRYDWEYRITGLSGTVNVLCVAFMNNTTPGFVPWRISRGGVDTANFNQLPAADLKELCEIFMPDTRFLLTADGGPADTTPAAHEGYLNTNRALWQSAWPYQDHVYIELWEDGGTNLQVGVAYDTAVRRLALANDDSYVPLYRLFGDYTTQASKNGWLQDLVHPGKLGATIEADRTLRVSGLANFAQIGDGRNVHARNVNARYLTIRGYDVEQQLIAQRLNNLIGRGAKWNINNTGRFQSPNALSAPIGTSNFTLSLICTILPTVAQNFVALVSTDVGVTSVVSSLELQQVDSNLSIYLNNGAGAFVEYRYQFLGIWVGGQTGVLTIRSDRANSRFDLFWNGEPVIGSLVPVVAGAGTPLSSWSGAGLQFGIPQGTTIDRCTNYYAASFWLSALSDAEILTNARFGRPTTTVPEFYYNFSDQIGRVVRDFSGNNHDAMFLQGNPNQYSIGTGPLWAYQRSGVLAPPWTITLGATTVLFGGDQAIVDMATRHVLTMPAAPRVGDQIRIIGKGAGGWRLGQPALTQIFTGAGGTVGTNATTIGTGGRIDSTQRYDSITLECITASAGVAYQWTAVTTVGTLTWV